MSNRYRLQGHQAMIDYVRINFMVELSIPSPRYNIAPNQDVPIVATDEFGAPVATTMTWNLLPLAEAQTRSPYPRTAAPWEDAFKKEAYLYAIQRRRCLVPADGFYEWEVLQAGSYKIPHVFELKGSKPFFFAGIYEHPLPNGDPDIPRGPGTFSILTTRPNPMVAAVADRMPVILPEDMAQRWITPGLITEKSIAPFIEPYPDYEMSCHPVTRLLNNVGLDTPRMAAPYAGDPPSQIPPR
jgi:putative SOS response-associated peptidase YedK